MDRIFLPKTDPKKYTGPLPSPEDVLIQMFKGLNYIHCDARPRLVHRDIKPQNVLISLPTEPSATPVIKWADFGLSKALQGSEMSFTPSGIKGTYYWMAPEMYKAAMGRNPNYRGTLKSDIFSVACVAFYFLTGGSHPFGPYEEVPKYVMENSPIYLHSNLRDFAKF